MKLTQSHIIIMLLISISSSLAYLVNENMAEKREIKRIELQKKADIEKKEAETKRFFEEAKKKVKNRQPSPMKQDYPDSKFKRMAW